MTSEHNVEQRIKIVRDGYIGNYSWDYGDGENINDWTQSTLMEMLNGIYYNSDSGNCYKSSSPTLCDFTDTGLKNMISKSMIDKNISWNLGGAPISQDGSNGLVTNLYTYERGSEVYQEDSIQRPVEWNATNSTHFNGVGLIYPSDYGWATNGGNLNRDKCFQQDLYHWSTEEYKLQCGAFDWLTPIYWEWTISQVIASRHAFKVNPAGYSNTGSVSVDTVGHVYPVVYLKSNVKIINDQQDGSYDKPYNLKLVE